jgi:actin-like ATPase involved in cell morphogenesis
LIGYRFSRHDYLGRISGVAGRHEFSAVPLNTGIGHMVDRARTALGLSIGATNLAAVTADLAIIRKPVLTLYRQRPPEVGLPSENPGLDEPGLVITDFVGRVGDPVGIVAADGSAHRGEALVADGLRALAYAATGGRPLPESVAVTYPAHWSATSVDAMGAALSRVAEWSDRARPPLLISDAAATLFGVRADPGMPARGTVAVCDFGGSGTSITLMDAGDYEPVAPTVRHHDFSGDMIDQALLTAVMANMPTTGSFDPAGTSAIGSLSRLRNGCRSAKEQLSSSTVTTVADELPGVRGDVRLTRNELDDAIRGSLNNFVAALDDTLRRNGIRDLVAVVSVGGGANIPAVTTMLSGHLRVPVVTTPRPQLAAAIGGGFRAAQGSGDNSPTAVIPAAPATAASATAASATAASATATANALATCERPVPITAMAWPKARTSFRNAPVGNGFYLKSGLGNTTARAALKFEKPAPAPSEPKNSVVPWRRLPMVVVVAAVVTLLLVGIALAIGLGSSDRPATSPGGSMTPASPAPPAPSATQQPPPPSGSDTNPPATTDTPATQEAPPATQEAPPASQEAPPASQEAPAATQEAPPALAPAPARAMPPIPPIPRIPAIPPIPPIPGINAPIPGLPGIPTLFSLIAPRAH